MNKPHKHAEIIKAWADGATIQYYNYNSSGSWEWRDADNPNWYENVEYRVKPEPFTAVKYHGILQGSDDNYKDVNHTTGYYSDSRFVSPADIEEGWELIGIVKTTFVDKLPVAVELLK